jgi:hypothetical protein
MSPRWCFGTFFLLFSACSYQLVSPPARIVTLGSARALAPGEMTAGMKGAALTSVFDPGVVAGTGQVRRGVTEHLELDAEVSYGSLQIGDGDSSPTHNTSLYAGRAGMKLAANHHVALTAGLGGGYAPAAGGFGSADLGGIVSYDNCYVIPFSALSGFVSQPVGAKDVDFGSHGTSRARTSMGFSAATGLEVLLLPQRCREGAAVPKLQLGFNLNYLVSASTRTETRDGSSSTTRPDYVALGIAGGVEIPF